MRLAALRGWRRPFTGLGEQCERRLRNAGARNAALQTSNGGAKAPFLVLVLDNVVPGDEGNNGTAEGVRRMTWGEV